MSEAGDMHLAEFNLGELRHDWDDPRTKDFVDGLDLVNGVAQRSPGFVWMLDETGMDAAQRDLNGPLGGNPKIAATLSVWQDVTSLENFVWNTVHRHFYERRAEWFDTVASLRLVMWWVPVGHRPDIAEAMARFRMLEAKGDTPEAFGWTGLREGQLWKTRGCNHGEAA